MSEHPQSEATVALTGRPEGTSGIQTTFPVKLAQFRNGTGWPQNQFDLL